MTRIILSHLEGNQQAARFYAVHGFTETHRESAGSGLPVECLDGARAAPLTRPAGQLGGPE